MDDMSEKRKPTNNGYAVYYYECVQNQDGGHEEGCKLFNRLEDALAYINDKATGFLGANMDFGIYELGERIPLVQVSEEEPQPPKVRKKYEIKDHG